MIRESYRNRVSIQTESITRQSALLGGIVGEIVGAIIGTLTGALTMETIGTLMGFTAGVILGALAGILVGVVVSKTAGASGGPSIGAYSGMGTGAILGAMVGMVIPDTLRMSPILLGTPVLETLVSSRTETIAFFAFLFSILGTIVGVWVSGKNYRPER